MLSLLKAGEESVNLLDPQKQLEDLFKRMFKSSGNDTENLEKLFKSKIDSLEFRLAESNRKLNGSLVQLALNTDSCFLTVREDITNTNKSFYDHFSRIEGKVGKGGGDMPPPPMAAKPGKTLYLQICIKTFKMNRYQYLYY